MSGAPNPEETGLGDRDEAGQRLELGAGGKPGDDRTHGLGVGTVHPCQLGLNPLTRTSNDASAAASLGRA